MINCNKESQQVKVKNKKDALNKAPFAHQILIKVFKLTFLFLN